MEKQQYRAGWVSWPSGGEVRVTALYSLDSPHPTEDEAEKEAALLAEDRQIEGGYSVHVGVWTE